MYSDCLKPFGAQRVTNLCICVEWERLHPPYLGHTRLPGWLALLSLLNTIHANTHSWAQECLSVSLPLFWRQIKIDRHPISSPSPYTILSSITPHLSFWPHSHPDFPVMTSERVHGSVITNLKLVIWPEMALALRISADKGPISQSQLFVKS